MSDSTYNTLNILRGMIDSDNFASAVAILSELKIMKISEASNKLLEAAEEIANKYNFAFCFKDKTVLAKALSVMTEDVDVEKTLHAELHSYQYPAVPGTLIDKFAATLEAKPENVLIAEAEKFIPRIHEIIDSYPELHFWLSAMNIKHAALLRYIYKDYENVDIIEGSIYSYGFTDRRFDLIISSPTYGTRTLAEDETFMCREADAVALENLSYHLTNGGKLAIIVPARTTFAKGKTEDLRNFIQQNFTFTEISSLPEGIMEMSGIKTCYLEIVNRHPEDDDISIIKYAPVNRRGRAAVSTGLKIEDETFIMPSELEELGDWNIDKVFSQQDEEWKKYQESTVQKDMLRNVAEIFRGKTVNERNETGKVGVITISSIGEHEINFEAIDHVDEEDRKIANYILQEGDVLLPARGTAIRTAVFHSQNYPCIANSNIIVIRPNKNLLNSTYLKIFLDSPLGNKLINNVQQGIAVMNISYRDLANIEIPVPPIEKQEEKAKAYTEARELYIKITTEAEKHWNNVLTSLQDF